VANEPRLAVESIAGQRPYQEDSVLAKSLGDGRILVAVADGMGGHAAGEVASALALETLFACLEDGKELDEAFVLANAEVHDKAHEPGKQGMGTTLVAALIDDGEYMVANVGDSRGYLISPEGIRQITEDHSFVAEALKMGQSQAEAMATPWRDALTRSVGTGETVDVDVFGPFPVKDDTALLICSDGLYKTLEDHDLHRIFSQSSGPRAAAQTLVAAALDSGSDDNISVVIAENGEVPRVSQGTMPLDFVRSPDDDLGSVTGEDSIAPSTEKSDADQPDSTMVGWTAEDADGNAADSDAGEVLAAVHETEALEAVESAAVLPVAAIVAAIVLVGAVIAFLVL
jgi:serine/threonine protein phosphatase PrpC